MNDIGPAFIEQARTLLKTDYLPKIERCLEQLSDADVWWRANDASNTIGNLLLHLEGNARQWIVGGLRGAPDGRMRAQEFAAGGGESPSAGELIARLRATLAEVDDVLAHLDPERLLERRRIQGRDDVTALEAVFHVVEHFSMHTGQIILLTKLRTGNDLSFYDFSDGAPRHAWQK